MKNAMQKVVIAVFIILCICFAAFIAIAVFFAYLESTSASTPDQRFYTRESRYYGIGIYDDSIWETDINFEQFEPLADDREFYLGGPETDDPDIFLNKYYLDSTQGFYKVREINDKNYYKELDCLFGTDESHINFILNIKYTDEEDEQWYVRKGYHIPSVENNDVSKLLIVQELSAIPRTESHPDFYRIETDNAVTVSDKQEIIDCLRLYSNKEYYLNNMEKYKLKDYPQQYYLVLAAFENDSLYQCIGYYYN
ncbi:MAG: hypothetical protein IJU45_06335 [Clostridia bacterium]|nr:hypothetical protein [Clostridia bacterium]